MTRKEKAGGERLGQTTIFEAVAPILVRAPLFPIEQYQSMGGAPAVEHLQNRLIQAAIAVSSRSLWKSIEKNSNHPRALTDRKLRRYLTRMCTRPTPYGLLAGVALADWGMHTQLQLSSQPPNAHARPDMGWLLSLAMELEALPAIRRKLRLFANPCAILHGERFYLLDRAPTGEPHQSQIIVKATPLTCLLLNLAREPIRYGDLIDAATSASDEKPHRQSVIELLDRLLDQTLLLTELRPPLTRKSPVQHVLDVLQAIPEASELVTSLQELDKSCTAFTQLQPTDWKRAYDVVSSKAEAIYPGDDSPTIQIDMAYTLDRTSLSSIVAREAARAAELVLRLSPYPFGFGYLDSYRQDFLNRYGYHREVPLLELLNPELGLGIPPWSQPLRLPNTEQRDQALVTIASEALANRERVVRLDARLLETLKNWHPEPVHTPPTVELYALIAAKSQAAIDAGDFKLVVGPITGANRAGRSFARFAHMFERDASHLLRLDSATADSHLDTLEAELVYLPPNLRLANVLVRPRCKDLEIALDSLPGVPAIQLIPVSELMIGVGHDRRFYIRWTRPNRRVSISSTHILASSNAPTVGRFLADLSTDREPLMQPFNWGVADRLPFLPRVECDRIVLRPARWLITRHLVEREFGSVSTHSFSDKLSYWRERWNVPRFVYLSQGDSRLLLDLNNARDQDEVRRELGRETDWRDLKLEEMVPDFADTWMRGPGGSYMAEFVIALKSNRCLSKEAAPPSVRPPMQTSVGARSRATRLFPPGSEWLYMKLYCSRSVGNDLLREQVRTLLGEILPQGPSYKFFFLRYIDQAHHLRIRFSGPRDHLWRVVAPALSALASGLIERNVCFGFSFDTYERESERYGGELAIEIAEDIFDVDSRSVLELLRLADLGALDTGQLGAISIYHFLQGLGMDPFVREEWSREHRDARDLAGPYYRANKPLLLNILLNEERGTDTWKNIMDHCRRRSESMRLLSRRLSEVQKEATLAAPLTSIYWSLLHMHCNRLLGVDRSLENRAIGTALRLYDAVQRQSLSTCV